jgi:hypothetical protein
VASIACADRFRPRRGPPGDDALRAASTTPERMGALLSTPRTDGDGVGDPLTTQRFQIRVNEGVYLRNAEWILGPSLTVAPPRTAAPGD